jgi:hypothetical protein
VASAEGYARAAAYKTGGEPVILRVLVSGDDLERDPDDKDISSGRYQYVTDRVALKQIKEIDGGPCAVRSISFRNWTAWPDRWCPLVRVVRKRFRNIGRPRAMTSPPIIPEGCAWKWTSFWKRG